MARHNVFGATPPAARHVGNRSQQCRSEVMLLSDKALTRLGSRFGVRGSRGVDRAARNVGPGCDDGVMSLTASSGATGVRPVDRVEVLFEELAELTGQRNAIDGRIVEIVAELDRGGLVGITGARSVPALVAWKTGSSSTTAHTIATIASRLEQFPRCAAGLREGRLSLDQVGVIAARAGVGSDAHYAALAQVATVSQLRTAVKLEPRPHPDPDPPPEPQRSITKTVDEQFTCWQITLPNVDAAQFDAALQSHQEALIAEWKHDHDTAAGPWPNRPPVPGTGEAFMRLVQAGWDTEAARRPHGQHTTVVVHLDVHQRAAALHLGPLLSEADRRYLTCDASCEVWFERDGQPIGSGRATRVISRRLRRALEHRHRTLRGAGLWRYPRSARPPHPALGRRRPHRTGQPGAAVPLSPPAAPSRRHHHHRTRTRSHRHRPRRPATEPRIAGPPTNETPTRGATVPRTHRRARPLVVV